MINKTIDTMTDKQKQAEEFVIEEINHSPLKEMFYNDNEAMLQTMKYYAHYFGMQKYNVNDEQFKLYASRVLAYEKGDAFDYEVYRILIELINNTGNDNTFLAVQNMLRRRGNAQAKSRNKQINNNVDSLKRTSYEVSRLLTRLSYDEKESWEYCQFIRAIFGALNSSKAHSHHIQKGIRPFQGRTRCMKLSTSGEVTKFLKDFSSKLKQDQKDKTQYPFCIFIYKGNIEDKLKNVTTETWEKLTNDQGLKDLICFYTPCDQEELLPNIKPPKYVCKTLGEILDEVRPLRERVA